MKQGISPIVAVVMLIAISVIGSVGVYFFVGGVATSQPTTTNPNVIQANLLVVEAGEVTALITNLGPGSVEAGTSFYISENGAETTNIEDIPMGTQDTITFWGESGQNFIGLEELTLYGLTTGATTIKTATAENLAAEGLTSAPTPTTNYGNITDTAAVNDDWPCLMQDSSEVYWVSFTSSNRGAGNYIYLLNSTDGETWDDASPIYVQTADPAVANYRPFMMQDSNGMYRIYYQESSRIRTINSTDPNSWDHNTAVAVTGNVVATDDFPSIIEAGGLFWMLYYSSRGGQNDLYLLNSTDGYTWDDTNAIQVTQAGLASSRGTLKYASGKYWVFFTEWDIGSFLEVYTMNTTNPNSWDWNSKYNITKTVMLGEEWQIATTCSAIADDDGRLLITASGWVDGTCGAECRENVYLYGAYSKGQWSDRTFVNANTSIANSWSSSNYASSIVQGADGKYLVAHENDLSGANVQIRFYTSTDSRIWSNP